MNKTRKAPLTRKAKFAITRHIFETQNAPQIRDGLTFSYPPNPGAEEYPDVFLISPYIGEREREELLVFLARAISEYQERHTGK